MSWDSDDDQPQRKAKAKAKRKPVVDQMLDAWLDAAAPVAAAAPALAAVAAKSEPPAPAPASPAPAPAAAARAAQPDAAAVKAPDSAADVKSAVPAAVPVAAVAAVAVARSAEAVDTDFIASFTRALNTLTDDTALRAVRVRAIEHVVCACVPDAAVTLAIAAADQPVRAAAGEPLVSADALSRALTAGQGQAVKALLKRFTDPTERIRAAAILLFTHCVTALPDASGWYALLVPVLLRLLIPPTVLPSLAAAVRSATAAGAGGDDDGAGSALDSEIAAAAAEAAAATPSAGAHLTAFRKPKRSPYHDAADGAEPAAEADVKAAPAPLAPAAAAAPVRAAAAPAPAFVYEREEPVRLQLLQLLHAMIRRGTTTNAADAAALAAANAAAAEEEKDLDAEERAALATERNTAAHNAVSRVLLPFVPELALIVRAALGDPAPDCRVEACACAVRLVSCANSALWQHMRAHALKLVDACLPLLSHKLARVRVAALDAVHVLVPCGAHEAIRDLAGFRESNVIDLREWMGADGISAAGTAPGSTNTLTLDGGRRNFFALLSVDANAKARARFYAVVCDWMLALPERFDYETLLMVYVLSGVSDENADIARASYAALCAIGDANFKHNETQLADEAYWGKEAEQIYRKHLIGVPPILPFPFRERPSLGLRHFIERFVPRYLPAICAELTDWKSAIRARSVALLRTLLVLHEDQIGAHAPKLLPVAFKLAPVIAAAAAGAASATAARDRALAQPIETCIELLGRYGHFSGTTFPLVLQALRDGTAERAAVLTVLRVLFRGAPPALLPQPLADTLQLLLTDAYRCTHETDVFVAVLELAVELLDGVKRLDAAARAALPVASLYRLLLSLTAWRDGGVALPKAAALHAEQQLAVAFSRLGALADAAAPDAVSTLHLRYLGAELDALAPPAAADASAHWAVGALPLAVLSAATRIVVLTAATTASTARPAASASAGADAKQPTPAAAIDALATRLFALLGAVLNGGGAGEAVSASQVRAARTCEAVSASQVRAARLLLQALAAPDVAVTAAAAAALSQVLPATVRRAIADVKSAAPAAAAADAPGGATAAAAAAAGVTHKTVIGTTTVTHRPSAPAAAAAPPDSAPTTAALMRAYAAEQAAVGAVSVRVLTSDAELRRAAERDRSNRVAVAREALAALRALVSRGALGAAAAGAGGAAAAAEQLELEILKL